VCILPVLAGPARILRGCPLTWRLSCHQLAFPRCFFACAPIAAPSPAAPRPAHTPVTCCTPLKGAQPDAAETWSLQAPPGQRVLSQQSQMGRGRRQLGNAIRFSGPLLQVWGSLCGKSESTVRCVSVCVGGVWQQGPFCARLLSEPRMEHPWLHLLKQPASPRPAAHAQCPPAVGGVGWKGLVRGTGQQAGRPAGGTKHIHPPAAAPQCFPITNHHHRPGSEPPPLALHSPVR